MTFDISEQAKKTRLLKEALGSLCRSTFA